MTFTETLHTDATRRAAQASIAAGNAAQMGSAHTPRLQSLARIRHAQAAVLRDRATAERVQLGQCRRGCAVPATWGGLCQDCAADLSN